MIEVKDLFKTYPGVVAVDRISFKVDRGEIVGFLGPNGAGKSTTMKILTCFLAPTSGAATVAGFDVLRQSMEVRRRVGYLPENNPLYTEMRVEEYLRFRARIKGVEVAEREKRIDAVLDRVGLQDRRRSIIQNLSKGLRQRVGLADAIVHNPEIVILDEPTIGLDPTQVREVRELIRELGRERTVLLSSHILSEVEKVCRRVLIMSAGRLVEQGTPAEIANRLMKTGRVRLEAKGDGRSMKEALEKVPGVASIIWENRGDVHGFLIQSTDGADVRAGVFRCCAEKGWTVQELAWERFSLEDAFNILTAAPAEAAK